MAKDLILPIVNKERNSMNNRVKLGQLGESFASKYLQINGYEILSRNFRYNTGEIDIIARRGEVISFIEVKTRAKEGYGYPEEAVTESKKRHIIRTANYYIMKNDLSEFDVQFDVIGVELTHIKNCI